jgi:hypothetical protein
LPVALECADAGLGGGLVAAGATLAKLAARGIAAGREAWVGLNNTGAKFFSLVTCYSIFEKWLTKDFSS